MTAATLLDKRQAHVPKTFVSKVRRTTSRLAAPVDPSPELVIPALC
jgi:hypothetical protein